MTVTCAVRYVTDQLKREAFETYAKNWLTIIPSLRRRSFGLFSRRTRYTNNIAHALISFEEISRPTRPIVLACKADPAAWQGQLRVRRARALLS